MTVRAALWSVLVLGIAVVAMLARGRHGESPEAALAAAAEHAPGDQGSATENAAFERGSLPEHRVLPH